MFRWKHAGDSLPRLERGIHTHHAQIDVATHLFPLLIMENRNKITFEYGVFSDQRGTCGWLMLDSKPV